MTFLWPRSVEWFTASGCVRAQRDETSIARGWERKKSRVVNNGASSNNWILPLCRSFRKRQKYGMLMRSQCQEYNAFRRFDRCLQIKTVGCVFSNLLWTWKHSTLSMKHALITINHSTRNQPCFILRFTFYLFVTFLCILRQTEFSVRLTMTRLIIEIWDDSFIF